LVQARACFQLSAEEIVRLVTGQPAQGLGISDTRGTVEPGKCADLVVLSGDLREDAAALTQVQAVYQDGVRVAAEGRLLLPSVATEATAAASAQQALLDTVFEELV
jgi:imidazolonepropionase-like amidohydrolase